LLASEHDSVSVSNQNFFDSFGVKFYYFTGHCNRHVQQSALYKLLCMTGTVLAQFLNLVRPGMNVFYSYSKTDLKLRCGSCMNSRYSGVPRGFK
jgi:hypothetical protein